MTFGSMELLNQQQMEGRCLLVGHHHVCVSLADPLPHPALRVASWARPQVAAWALHLFRSSVSS